MPRTTIGEIPPAEQARRLAELRRARSGYLLTLQVLFLCAAGRTPTEIAAVLFCSRSPVYRVVTTYRARRRGEGGEEEPDTSPPPRSWSPALRRSVRAILHVVPRAGGGCRPRWSWAPSALELQARRGLAVSAEPVRRWRHQLAWGWKRAKLGAKDDDPQRGENLARIRLAVEQLGVRAALFFAAELDIALLPKVGYQGRPKGEQGEVLTPGTNEKRYLAGALAVATGRTPPCGWQRKPTGLFLDLLTSRDRTYPAPAFTHLAVVVANAKIPKALEVEKWLVTPPRFELLFLPPSCPKAHPLARAFGDVQDKGTRTHTRKQIWRLGDEVEQHLQVNGPWRYALSEIYYTPEVTAAVQELIAAQISQADISQLAA